MPRVCRRAKDGAGAPQNVESLHREITDVGGKEEAKSRTRFKKWEGWTMLIYGGGYEDGEVAMGFIKKEVSGFEEW